MLTTAYYFSQVVLCSGVMMGYYWLVLRNKRFHQYNRFYLLAIALLSWIVPLIKIRWSHPVVSQDTQMIRFLSVVADNNSQICLLHRGIKKAQRITPGFLGCVHRGISLLEQIIEILPVIGKQ